MVSNNDVCDRATTVREFRSTSLFSKVKAISALIPARSLNADERLIMTRDVL